MPGKAVIDTFPSFLRPQTPLLCPFYLEFCPNAHRPHRTGKIKKTLAVTAVSLDISVDLTLACDVTLLDSKPGFMLGRFCRVYPSQSINIQGVRCGGPIYSRISGIPWNLWPRFLAPAALGLVDLVSCLGTPVAVPSLHFPTII